MDIMIRKADLSDLDLLIKWRMEVIKEVFPSPEYSIPEGLKEANRRYYERAIPAGEHIACFACAKDETVGCGGLCLYSEMPSPDNPGGKCAYLMNIYTVPSFRRQGVGEAVVQWLIGQARDEHITKIYLETSEDGRRLYEKLGFTDMKDMMILPVSLQ